MKIAFEGPPAAGKSTLAEYCAATGLASVVPEVNQLFNRPDKEPADWYLERQVCRWELAQKKQENGSIVIFDGDPFQPLWFGWIYSDEEWTSMEECESFYRRMIQDGRIGFPDLYIFFMLPEEERRIRESKRGRMKAHDENRILNKYKRYIRLVAPQRIYFEALREKFPSRVLFYESKSVENGARLLERLEPKADPAQDIMIFDFLVGWLKKNPGEPVASGQRC